jgi:hypothetical protein
MKPETMTDLIDQIVPATALSRCPNHHSDSTSVINLEERLTQFVDAALKASYSQKYSPQSRMELLERAWKAQKLLWQLRAQRALELDKNNPPLEEDYPITLAPVSQLRSAIWKGVAALGFRFT